MADDLGVTFTGFVAERFPEARARVVVLWKGRFGESSPTQPGTVQGLIIDVIANVVALLWESVEDVYANSFLRSAFDRGLDNWVTAFGFLRGLPTQSSGAVVFWGDALAQAPTATALAVGSTGARFATTESAQIHNNEGQVWVYLITDATQAGYSISIDPGAEVFNVVPADADPLVIAGQLRDEINGGSAVATAVVAGLSLDGDGVLVVFASDPGVDIVVDDFDELYQVAVPAALAGVLAVAAGPVQAVAGSLNTLVFGASGIQGVINAADVEVGDSREQDGVFRRRFLLGQGVNEKATTRAIRSAILRLAQAQGLVGAEVKCRENTEDVVVDGLDPHSIAPLVYAPGLDPDLINQAILDTKANGYKSTGSVTTNLIDSSGLGVVVGHTPATVLYLHVRVELDVLGENFPGGVNSLEAIRLRIADDLGAQGRLQIGTDLYRTEIVASVVSAMPPASIKALTVLLDATPAPDDPPTVAAVDLEPDDFEILVADATRIIVVS